MEYNDYELVFLAQENNEDALEILHNKYKGLITSKANEVYYKIKRNGIAIEDIVQEAMIAFDNAILNFNQDDKAIFFTFANLCIDRQLKNLIAKTFREKYKVLNESLALDDDENNLYNVLSSDITPETELFNKTSLLELKEKINKLLTPLEKNIFELKVSGFTNNEISNTLNISNKKIYNTFDNIRKKINKVLNK